MNRRGFVKTSATAAAASALAGGLAGVTRPLARVRPAPLPPVPYYGAHRVNGPAPRGVPYVPVRVNANGAFEGVPEIPAADGDGTVNVLDWYRYCDHGNAPGLDPARDAENTLRYFVLDDPARTLKPWFEERAGALVRPGDFPDVDFGASFAWRSEGASGKDVLTGVLVRLPADAVTRVTAPRPPGNALSEDEIQYLTEHVFTVLEDSVFIAVSSFCTHFCCAPGFKHTKAARSRNAWDQVYCACHGSVFEPREPVRYAFSPEA